MAPGREDDLDLQRAVTELQAGIRVELNSRRIFDSFYPWIHRFFRHRGYAPQDCEDLAQETLFQVFDRIDSYRHEGPFKSWVFAVAANLHRRKYRWRHREKRNATEVSITPATEEDPVAPEPVAPGDSPAREAYERERREALAQALKRLPPQMRQVLTLRIDQDLKYREIAEVLHISIETVKAHLFQARQRLRAELGEEYGEWVE
ncbi:MAG TPA: RNA polymerase sigma factor [Thermoanaerobaculia bacterium]|nr:RNA polymerase sigma factor [Thermoanaerobaculia bacterium]